jgi:hypothetical protein
LVDWVRVGLVSESVFCGDFVVSEVWDSPIRDLHIQALLRFLEACLFGRPFIIGCLVIFWRLLYNSAELWASGFFFFFLWAGCEHCDYL